MRLPRLRPSALHIVPDPSLLLLGFALETGRRRDRS